VSERTELRVRLCPSMFVRAGQFAVCCIILLLCGGSAWSYPEFQKYSQDRSGRRVDCAMCHISPAGPSGTGFGQISSLGPAEKQLLDEARKADAPGTEVKNPILNAFGNNLVKQLGRAAISDMTTEPEKLAPAYGFQSDIDRDGIPDAREFLDGTDPTNNQSGQPWLLFRHNMREHWFGVISMALASALILFGFQNLFRWYMVRGSP
jgi:hypothetical protein